MKPEYTSDRRRSEILYECLRHKVAHLAYPYAVFDTTTARSKTFDGQPRRRVTWSVHETERRPAIEIIDYSTPERLVKTPTPWPVSYDCRIEVSVRSLAIDIVWSIEKYLQDLQSNPKARENFATRMEHYFPPRCSQRMLATVIDNRSHEETADPLYADRESTWGAEVYPDTWSVVV
jgi:hypothetical protein